MTLRRRMLVALFVLALTFGVFGAGVVAVQRHYLIGRLDARLAGYAASPLLVVNLSGVEPDQVSLSEVYVGRLAADGRLTTVFAPSSDPDLVPDVRAGDVLPDPVERGTTAGQARGVRVVTAPLSASQQVVFAIPTTAVDDALLQLTATLTAGWLAVLLAVAALFGWFYRQALRPYARLVGAARAVNRGERRERLDVAAGGSEAAELARAYNALLDASAASTARTARFTADATRELREPLAELFAESGRYARPARASDAYGLVDLPGVGAAVRRIDAGLRRVLATLDDLFLVNQLDAGADRGGEQVDLGELVRDAGADLAQAQPGRPLTVDGPDSLVVGGDEVQLRRALAALVDNAVQHTAPDAAVRLSARAVGKRVRVEVRDEGAGIAPEDQPHLFERLHRGNGHDAEEADADAPAEASAPTKEPGTPPAMGQGPGLGLAVVAAVVKAHGGDYGMSSAPQRGSVFWFELPR